MKILIACEYSSIVRTAFEKKGWDAWSCDLLDTEMPGKHYKGDVFDIINNGFDMMIAHPPCTFLTYAGMACWNNLDRVLSRIEAAKFFMDLYCAPIPYIAIENPQGIMSKIFRNPDQTIHPYYFGDNVMKRTNLWLKNLPVLEYQLEPTLFSPDIVAIKKPEPIEIQIRKSDVKKNRYQSDCLNVEFFKNSKQRSRFFPGIAKAMAEQWTEYFLTTPAPAGSR